MGTIGARTREKPFQVLRTQNTHERGHGRLSSSFRKYSTGGRVDDESSDPSRALQEIPFKDSSKISLQEPFKDFPS